MATIASTRKRCINPERVQLLTIPKIHNTNRITAIVSSILPFSQKRKPEEGQPGGVSSRRYRSYQFGETSHRVANLL
jgi:hypothetical protein